MQNTQSVKKMMSYDLGNMKAGDIILSRGVMLARTISLFTNGRFTHAMIYMGDGFAYHTDREETKKIGISDMKFIEGDSKVIRINRELKNSEIQAISDYLDTQIGANYDYAGAGFSIRWMPFDKSSNSSDKQFCSRLITRAYRDAGIELSDKGDFASPNDLDRSDLLFKVDCEKTTAHSSARGFESSQVDLISKIDNLLKHFRRTVSSKGITTANDILRFNLTVKQDTNLSEFIDQEFNFEPATLMSLYNKALGFDEDHRQIQLACFGADITSMFKIYNSIDQLNNTGKLSTESLLNGIYSAILRKLEQHAVFQLLEENQGAGGLNRTSFNDELEARIIGDEIYERTGRFVYSMIDIAMLSQESDGLDELIRKIMERRRIGTNDFEYSEFIELEHDEKLELMIDSYSHPEVYLGYPLQDLIQVVIMAEDKRTKTLDLIIESSLSTILSRIDIFRQATLSLASMSFIGGKGNSLDFERLLNEDLYI